MFDKRLFFLGLFLFSFSLYAQSDSIKSPELKFDVDTADFGIVADGDSVVYEFWFTNIGQANLEIKQAWPACGCTHPTYTKGPVKPGGRGFVRVVFNSKGFAGHEMVKEVIIINNGPERYARFKVKVMDAQFLKEVEAYKKSINNSGKDNTKMSKKEKRKQKRAARKNRKEANP
ncbi:MAG: DUF1573 domain-containing protein [Bacteroidetes bacterium]|nr:DUF1573 domain-containing protein [Bacteroidota bacterium]